MYSRLKILRIVQKISIDRKIELGYLFSCTKRNRNGVIALYANELTRKIEDRGLSIHTLSQVLGVNVSLMHDKIDNVKNFTINEVLKLKSILDLSDSEAINIFLEV